MTPEERKKTPMLDIALPPPQKFELRVVVWGVKGMPVMDPWTEQNDLYVSGQLGK